MSESADERAVDRRGRLYHYTSAPGLDGICIKMVCGGTDAAFLNDWREINYAAEPLI